MSRKPLLLAIGISAAVHLAFIGVLAAMAWRASAGALGGGGTGGVVIMSFIGGDEGGTGGSGESSSNGGSRGRALTAGIPSSDIRRLGRADIPVKSVIPRQGKARVEGSLASSGHGSPVAGHGVSGESADSSGPVKAGGDGSGGHGGDGHGWGSAGSGGGAGGGHGGGMGPSRGKGDPRLAAIWAKINRAKYYPRLAKKNGWEGSPRVTFAITKFGEVESVTLAKSCGIPELDQAALETVKRSAPLPHYPKPITLAIRYAVRE